jgi:extracellular matrix regulatory protein A
LSERRSEGDEAVVLREAGSGPARPRLLNVGYGNLVAAGRIVAIVAPGASPMRRLRRDASNRGKLVDATEGRRTRSILVLDSDHVVLSAINPETLATRLGGGGPEDAA